MFVRADRFFRSERNFVCVGGSNGLFGSSYFRVGGSFLGIFG